MAEVDLSPRHIETYKKELCSVCLDQEEGCIEDIRGNYAEDTLTVKCSNHRHPKKK